MRTLKYPKLVSVQSFQQPNFELVAALLSWMVHRYDADIAIHGSIETENDRVRFITDIVKGFFQKANVKLNPKKLYAADGHAVKELLKLASLLHEAVILNAMTEGEEFPTSNNINGCRQNNISKGTIDAQELKALIDLNDIKELRRLASEITENGARLYELLRAGGELQNEKQHEGLKFLDVASAGFDDSIESQQVHTVLIENVEKKKKELINVQRNCQLMESDETDLLEEIKKKKVDLERNRNRLESIQHARPAFMDEYEELEIELQKHYELYMERYRNVHYLKREMEKFQKEDEERLNEILMSKKKLQSKIQEEELKILRDQYPGSKNGDEISTNPRMVGGDVVPMLDTTDDSVIFIDDDDEDDDDDDDDDDDGGNDEGNADPIILGGDGDQISFNGSNSSSSGTSTSGKISRGGSQTVISSRGSSSFSVLSGLSSHENDINESNDTNESSDSNDDF